MENVTKEAGGGYFCHDSSPAGCMGCITHYSRNIQRLKSFKKKRKENSLIQKRNFLPPLSLSLLVTSLTYNAYITAVKTGFTVLEMKSFKMILVLKTC